MPNPAIWPKLAKALVTLAASPEPPFRMPFGSDTVAAIDVKNRVVAAEFEKWRAVWVGTTSPRRQWCGRGATATAGAGRPRARR